MVFINTSFTVNNSEIFNEIIGENNSSGIDTYQCDPDILELQTRKLSVLVSMSILTLLSNMAILLAILSRPGKVG